LGTNLTEAEFNSELIPFFEAKQRKLASLLPQSHPLEKLTSKMKLVFIDNQAEGEASYLCITENVQKSQYLRDTKPTWEWLGFSSDSFQLPLISISIIDAMRLAFISILIANTKPKNLIDYFGEFLETNYRYLQFWENKKFSRFGIMNLNFNDEHPLFAISAYRVNLIVPKVGILDAGEISDNTAENQKILITTKENLVGYTHFDHIIARSHLTTHFDTSHFVSGIGLFQRVLSLNLGDTIHIVEQLRTTSESDIYDAKKDLATVNLSNGKSFERALRKMLNLCLEPEYERLRIKEQVPNRGRLRVRDYVVINSDSKSSFLRKLLNRGVELLLFEAKNYSKKISTRDLDTFVEYIRENPYFGNFGIILSRLGVSENCDEAFFRKLQADKIIVIVLTEDDLVRMLDYVDSGRSAVDILEDKYVDLILKL